MVKMNQIQFQAGLSLSQFLDQYGKEEHEVAVGQSRWPYGFSCRECSATEHCIVWHNKVRTFLCNACHHQTTLISGTIFHASKLPLRKWLQAMYFLTQSKKNVAALELKRLLGVYYRTAGRLKQKLLAVMTEREADRQLEGRIEVDDVYLGGEHPGGKPGRGSESKVSFIGALKTDASGHPQYAIFFRVKTFSLDEVENWAKRHLLATSTVVSDGLAYFSGVTAAGARHEPAVVGTKRKNTDMPCFNWNNTILGNLKTATSGTYHAFDFRKYGFRYLAEAQYRFNRRFDLTVILPRLRRTCVATGKWTEAWLRLAKE